MQHPAAPAPWIERQIRQLVDRRGHAWLLQGPTGLGQYPLALALARNWLCEQPGPGGACGVCPSCHAIEVRAHADLAVLMPETLMIELGWPLSEKAQGDIDDKKRKPSREIRVEGLRDVVEFAQRTSARGRGKVVLVYPAERMNAIAANTLLKTLEEPAGDVKFVLASESAHQLLPTIRSRCQLHTMQWPTATEALAWLQGQGVVAADAERLLRAAGGRPDDALAYLQSGRIPSLWARLPAALAQGDASVLASLTPAQAIEALQKLCHDLLLLASGAEPRFFVPADLPPPGALAARYKALSDWSKALSKSARTADHPFNPGLMLEALASDARRALHLP
ncbi:MAG: DNA polymerase III subunit delta' [Burkholderiaceae bacterium]|nr:DNA polymerase III subunit delta' [Burkholderiaceae bacterium]